MHYCIGFVFVYWILCLDAEELIYINIHNITYNIDILMLLIQQPA